MQTVADIERPWKERIAALEAELREVEERNFVLSAARAGNEIRRAAEQQRADAAEAERDFLCLLARAVLGCSVTTYEVADQTIAIFDSEKMIWAAWGEHGELDDETHLPKRTPELMAALRAAIDSGKGVESVQGLQEKLSKLDAAEAKLAAVREKMEQQIKHPSLNGFQEVYELVKEPAHD